MRLFLDDIWKKRTPKGYSGGCLRISDTTEYPILVQFSQDIDGWRAIDPRPEGFAIFGALFREGLASEIYNLAGIRVVLPIVLYRNNVQTPFLLTDDAAGIEAYIRMHFYESLPEALQEASGGVKANIRFEETTYFDMD